MKGKSLLLHSQIQKINKGPRKGRFYSTENYNPPKNDAMTGFYDAQNTLFDTINRALKLTFWMAWGVLTLVFILILSISFCGVKFIKHEKSQQDRIACLEGKVILLQAESNKSTVNWNSNDFNYLAIGNSITIHPLNEYWCNECGMVATTAENDYVHLVASALDAKTYAYNFATWEMIGHDRGETLSLLDGLLSNELDLVSIQLSENVSDLSTF